MMALAPKHLSPDAQKLYRKLHKEYVFEGSASVLLLTTLCESWDLARKCREALEGQDLVSVDKHGGLRPHPLLAQCRSYMGQVNQIAKTLRIHLDTPDSK